jgi:hypothetical protein
LDEAHKDRTILVPLTASLYVPGTLADHEKVLVDVGTGFYVEKTKDKARVFYEAKIEEMGKNLENLEKIINGKNENLAMVEDGKWCGHLYAVKTIHLFADLIIYSLATEDIAGECARSFGRSGIGFVRLTIILVPTNIPQKIVDWTRTHQRFQLL